ncbi:photosystem II reaction center protein Psb28 [Synechocystis sp. LKSZ1]|uniref:photosystem II reaction center protein Psb28 n=1 Tax=Synechocystis sp. LKSZ1 TaxID=3144951 RepID=UPI00336C0284
MATLTPTIEFFEGLAEDLSNVSLRRNQKTGQRTVVMTFKTLQAIEKFQSFTQKFNGHLRLTDEEGIITVEPSSVKFIFGGDDGDDIRGAQCTFELVEADHWDRFMRFMDRYAAANGMGYQEKETAP